MILSSHFQIHTAFRGICLALFCGVSIACLLLAFSPAARADELAKHNVVWDSPSVNSHGSMPIGNGDVGINTWVEPTGDLVYYLSKTDARNVTHDRERNQHSNRNPPILSEP